MADHAARHRRRDLIGVCSVDDPGNDQAGRGNLCLRSSVQASPATCKTLIGVPASIQGTTGSAGADGGDCGLDTNLDGQVDDLVQSTASSCPAGTSVSAGTCNAGPDDFKRLVTLVTWDRGGGSRCVVLQQATVPFPGLSAYGAITALTLNGYATGANGHHPAATRVKLTLADERQGQPGGLRVFGAGPGDRSRRRPATRETSARHRRPGRPKQHRRRTRCSTASTPSGRRCKTPPASTASSSTPRSRWTRRVPPRAAKLTERSRQPLRPAAG